MPLSRSRDYLSIGEVLDQVREDFPEVSVSKIRFLEAEGLINPERTQSGYRKFFEKDVRRLRHILALQRDQFLPLRVIRQRLDEIEANGGPGDALGSAAGPPAEAAGDGATVRSVAASTPPADVTSVQLTRHELLEMSGLPEQALAGLEDFGILERKDGHAYDGEDLIVAKAARGMLEFGIEPRHLRMYRQAVDREGAFIEQIVAPLARRRDVRDAQAERSRSVARLMALSRQLREALLRTRVKQLL